MFNRFFEPDIDINNMSLVSADSMSASSELRNSLRYIGMVASEIPMFDIAASTGVHTGEDAVKAILAGASAVQVCSALYYSGLEAINEMNTFITEWMTSHSFNSIGDFRGMMNYGGKGDDELYQRVQYMRFFPKG